MQSAAAADLNRRRAVARPDDRTHLTQRLGNALHRTPAQGFIADQVGIEGLPRQQSREQTHRGARIAHVERAGGRLQPAQAHARHADARGAQLPNLNTEQSRFGDSIYP